MLYPRRQSSREGSGSGWRGSMGPPSGNRTPRKDERSSLLETACKLTSTDRNMGARQRTRESSPSLCPRPTTPQAAAHKYNTEITSEMMKGKSSAILTEFSSILDYKNLEGITATKGKVMNDEERYYAAIRDLLKKNLEHDDIFNMVEDVVPAAERSKPAFLRALTTSVCRNAIKGTGELAVCKETLGKHVLLLRKFLENDSAKQLQALYALQRLMVLLEHPPNILKDLFLILYDEDVISENTFVKWKTSSDQDEQEGKSVTVASAKPLLTWLRLAECKSD